MDMCARHHAYLERELPVLCRLALQVRGNHAVQEERLGELVAIVARLRAELEAHVLLQRRTFLEPCGEYAGELLEWHARELEAEIAGLAGLTGGFSVDQALSDEHRVLVRRLGALAADTARQLETERQLVGLRRLAPSAA